MLSCASPAGKRVASLRKHADVGVREAASAVVEAWKKQVAAEARLR